jgi:hypothetical protein
MSWLWIFTMRIPQVKLLAGSSLPGHLAFGSWQLTYCTHRDGYSLKTLYRKACGRPHTLLIVQDTSEYIYKHALTIPSHCHASSKREACEWCMLALNDMKKNDWGQHHEYPGRWALCTLLFVTCFWLLAWTGGRTSSSNSEQCARTNVPFS